jgi:hypothetical protein
MKINEIITEDATAGATASGNIASLAMPIGSGEIVRRSVYGDQKKKKKQLDQA